MIHKPEFRFTPEEVILWCRKNHHCDMCAAQVLALMALMVDRGWNISQLADHSHVGRATISEILSLHTFGSPDTFNKLAETFGLRLIGFYLFAHFCYVAEVSP